MGRNLCLICCYSFPEKRNRIISDETRESFRKFCGELQVPLVDNGGEKKDKTCGLDLPYGEDITVCGDCLSLVVLYVQRRTVQSGKEERVRELQKAVCAALKDLQEVVEEVQGHIDDLHSTIRTGDVSCLDTACRTISAFMDKENNPRAFRAKVLKLNTGLIKAKTVRKDGLQIPINIKLEPRERTEEGPAVDDDVDDSHFDDSYFAPENEQYFEEAEFSAPKIAHTTGSSGCSKTIRASRRSVAKSEEVSFTEEFFDDSCDFDDPPVADLDEDSVASNSSDDDGGRKVKKRRRGRRPSKMKKQLKLPKKEKPEVVKKGSDLAKLKEVSEQEASQWKDDLISRIVMQLNDDIYEDNADATSESTSNSFQYIDGKLMFRGTPVKIHERQRLLQCTKCNKKYYQERDVGDEGVQLETLVRDHILSMHNDNVKIQKKKDTSQAIDCVMFPSLTNNKITSTNNSRVTYKLACPLKYTYRRRYEKTGVVYYVCDYLPKLCSAAICRKDGLYFRLRKGWNADGSHSIHAPDEESTNRQIQLGNAKLKFMNDSSKSIDDICAEIVDQSNGEPPIPMERLRRRMIYAKYRRYGLPDEEKAKISFPCPHCGSVSSDRRRLNRHINSCQDNPSKRSTGSRTKSSARNKSATLVKKARKVKTEPTTDTEASDPQASGPSNAPSIVFNDPSVANNFVNKCITAIMQQVGVSVPGNVQPSPAQSDTSQQGHGPSAIPGQWPQPSSSAPARFSPHQNPSGNNTQMHGWPWTSQ